MKDDTILFHCPTEEYRTNRGGPIGFIAQNILNQNISGLIHINDIEIDFCSRLKYKICRNLVRIDPKTSMVLRSSFQMQSARWNYVSKKCNTYRKIYIHDYFDYFAIFDLIPADQIVIFQPHHPALPHQEYCEYILDLKIFECLKAAEGKLFDRADYLVFPNEGARSIYDSLISNPKRVAYILSGGVSTLGESKIPLSKSTINILFMGRRNSIKGFDLFASVFERIHKMRPEFHFLIAGKGNSVSGPNVTDLGIQNDPALWMRSVDYVLNFNKQSYLDLSIIEALSLGARLIMTATHGHKYFDGKGLDIHTLNTQTEENLINLLLDERVITKPREPYSNVNYEFYSRNLTPDLYRKRLSGFLREI